MNHFSTFVVKETVPPKMKNIKMYKYIKKNFLLAVVLFINLYLFLVRDIGCRDVCPPSNVMELDST